MPVITFDGPELSTEKKRQLVEEFTNSASKITGIPERAFVVTVRENKPENIGVSGQLLVDRE